MDRLRRLIVYAAAAMFAAALVLQFRELGGPWFAVPETIQDHVASTPYPSRDAIVMSRRAARLIPRRSRVTVIMPSQAPDHDPTLNFVAVGLMPHHIVVGTDRKGEAQYVITVREPLQDAGYELRHSFAEGSIYARR